MKRGHSVTSLPSFPRGSVVIAISRLVEQLSGPWDARRKWESYDELIDVGAVEFRLFEELAHMPAPA
ncbi:hypothetical protein ILFOPFJJ_06685 [Ensifer psoraleae]|uniref:hypothetical protein n=1 Tax=Sinorhizobium psoraleae TaxID=520838 RepID=UPI001568B952|nr:hypothetical protein [Sinorhizobium psoraleae]NRP75762.1 hypothetical protein [Sinorhizobium psoraleae]